MPGSVVPGLRGTAVTVIAIASLAACAGNPEKRREVSAEDICPPDSTLFCRKRMGKIYSCTCKSRESLRDILEPYPE